LLNRFKFLFILSGFLPVICSAIIPQCITVGSAGDVSISWDVTGTNAADFRSWYLYHSNSAAGPFTAVDSTFLYTDTSANDPAANATLAPAYYVIAFKSITGQPDILSDTIRVIQLNIGNAGGNANLSWNATHNPLNPNDSHWYLIYREYPPGNFILLDSVDASTVNGPMTFTEPVTICDDTIKYRIDVRNNSGCVSSSALKGDRFQDTQVPIVPQLDSVSVDLINNSIVSWTPSTSIDTYKYIVFLQSGGTVTSIDTVIGLNNTTVLTTISAQFASKTFFILALDSCNNISSPSSVHSTIYLEASFDRCNRSAELTWSPYTFWNSVPQYQILVSINGGNETIAGTTTNTTFIDTNLTSGTSMCYRIRAIDPSTGRTSTSNRACIAPSFPPAPAFCYIRKATVLSENEIGIYAYVDAAASVSGYTLYRSGSQGGPYSVVSTVYVNGTSSLSFVDNVEASKGPYFYYLNVNDSCGVKVLSSQIVQTMVLDAEANDDYTNDIEWSEYEGWPTGVREYLLYVTTGDVTSAIHIANNGLPPFDYIHSVINEYFSSGKFCYVIEAVEEIGNPYLFQDSSRSNEVCVEQVPLIYIPNAFHPGGDLNNVFYPSNAFVSTEKYSLDIYNRWGQVVFHSDNPHEGWDGSYKNKMCPEGVYVYRLIAKNGLEADIEKVGSVTLIR
jgi:gliding motility-associated-like protein